MLKAISHSEVQSVEFFDSKNNISETVNCDEATRRIRSANTDNLSIKINSLNKVSAKKIVDLC